MITSIKNWRQRLFTRSHTIIGVAFNDSHICLVKFTWRKQSWKIGQWYYVPYLPEALTSTLIMTLRQAKWHKYPLSGVLEMPLLAVLTLPVSAATKEEEYLKAIADALLQTGYLDVSRLLLALPLFHVAPDPALSTITVLVGENLFLKNYLQSLQSLTKNIVSIDWQPLARCRVLWLVYLAITLAPAARGYFLTMIKTWNPLHLDALGAALNGGIYDDLY